MVEAYCVKCGKQDKEKGKGKKMKTPEIVKTARGGYMAKGTCTTCGTKMAKILSKDQAEAMKKAA